jgi:hypothetical protein
MFQQLKNKFQARQAEDKAKEAVPFKTAMHKAAQAGGTAGEEKVQEQKIINNFVAGPVAGNQLGFEKAVKEEPKNAGQNVDPSSTIGKGGFLWLLIIGFVVFVLTQCKFGG